MKRILLLVSIAFLLTSCASAPKTTSPTSDVASGTSRTLAPEPELRLRLADTREDIMAVFVALHAALQDPGAPLSGPVLFGQRPLIEAQNPQLGTFGLADVMLETDDQIGDNPLHRRLDGVMRLADPMGRDAYWSCAAEYIVQDEGILILSSAMMPVQGRFDRIHLFFVSPEQLPAPEYLRDVDHAQLLEIAASNALSPDEIAAENGVRELLLFVIDMTRSAADTSLALYSDGSIADAAVRSSTSQNDDGWRSLMVEGAFRFGPAADYRLYITEESPTRPESRVLAEVEPGST